MRNNKSRFFFFITGFSVMVTLSAQTAGTLSFSCDTYAPNSDYGTKHVLAVWIQNSADPSIFIKTRAKYGKEDDHLTSWIAISDKNLVDAVAGSTLASYGTITSKWDGKDVSGELVPDGEYKVYIEMGWGRNKTDDHAVNSFVFTKGNIEDTLTLAGNNNFSNVAISWIPESVSAVPSVEGTFPHLRIFPNPANENITIDFGDIPVKGMYTCKIINELGQVIWREAIDRNYFRIKSSSLGGPGNYYLQVTDGDRNVKALRAFVIL